MSFAMIFAVAGLTAAGTYLITARALSRIILGFSLLGHAAVLGLLAAGGPAGRAPIADQAESGSVANPLPQALALTAIVIAFGLTLFLLSLARSQHVHAGNDVVEDEVGERRKRRREEKKQAKQAAHGQGGPR